MPDRPVALRVPLSLEKGLSVYPGTVNFASGGAGAGVKYVKMLL